MKERAAISYFFHLYPNLCLCERREKNSFTYEAVLKISEKNKTVVTDP